jgi:hypothetical protein
MPPARLALPLASLLCLALILVATVPARRGLRCRFWLTERATASPVLPEGASPGLLRREYQQVDFTEPGPVGVDLKLDSRWEPAEIGRNRSFRWTGWVHVPEDGVWSFGTRSDDGSFVVIDGWVVATNWADHMALTRWGRVSLKSGLHRIRVDFYQRDGSAQITLLWRPPRGQPEVVPEGRLFHARGEVPGAVSGFTWAADRLAATPVSGPWERLPPKDGGLADRWSWADVWGGWTPDDVVACGTGTPRAPLPGAKAVIPPGVTRVWRAHLETEWTAPHRFELASSVPTIVYVDDTPVLGKPGAPAIGPVRQDRTLPAGPHNLRVVTAPRGPTLSPRLTVSALAQAGAPVPKSRFWSHRDAVAQDLVERIPPDQAPLAQAVHRRLDFLTGMSLSVPYMNRWDVTRLGFPSVLAPLRATWDGELVVDRSEPCTFTLRGTGQQLLVLGEHVLYKGPDATQASATLQLAMGRVPIHLDVSEPGLIRQVALFWQFPGETMELVPAAHLVPAGLERTTYGQLALGVPLLVMALACLFGSGGRGGSGARAWVAFVARTAAVHVWVLLLVLGVALRLHQYTDLPGPGDTDDEYNHHLEGTSIVTGRIPIGWDWHGGFPVVQPLPFYGRIFRIVAPMVFYPPAFTVMVGALNRAAGATSAFEARMEVTRLLPIALSAITLALVWPVSRAVGLSTPVGLLATAFLALYPVAVMINRLIKEENLVAPLYLGVVWLLADGGRAAAWKRLAIGASCTLAVMTKQMGIATTLLAFAVFCVRGQLGAAVLAALHGALGVLVFLWYGLAWGGEAFVALQREHMVYASRLDALWPLLAENKVTDAPIGSSWILGLWVAFAIFGVTTLARDGGGTDAAAASAAPDPAPAGAPAATHGLDRATGPGLVVLAIACYLLVLLLSYPPDRNYGWYRLPLLPLLAICWAAETVRLFSRFEPVRAVLWIGLFVLPCAQMLDQLANPPPVETVSALNLSVPVPEPDTSRPGPTLLMRSLVLALAFPALVLPALPGRARRALTVVLATCLAGFVLASFAVLSCSWGDIYPARWAPDPVLLVELEP